MSTISLVMIVKNEEEILRNCVDSVKDIIDEFIIVDTGSSDKTKDIILPYCSNLYNIPFTNYVDTKNEALKLATKDYILFMDADERVVKGLDILKKYANEGVDCVCTRIVEGPSDISDSITNTYFRNRLWKNDGSWKFKGNKVHEVICGSGNIIHDGDIHVRHEHLKNNKAELSTQQFEQYIKWLSDAVEKDPQDTRSWFYLARTYKDLGQNMEAIDAYNAYLSLNSTFLDERWQAAYDSAICWKKAGEYNKAFDCLDQAAQIDSRRAETYNLKGRLYYNLQNWNKAIECYERSISCKFPEDVVLFINPQEYTWIPWDFLSICYDRVKEYKKAYNALNKAITLCPFIDERMNKNLIYYNKFFHKKIFMTLGNTPESVYGGIFEDKGVGGVETAYIELSKNLVKLGHSVFLFCNCDKEHVYENVHYIPYDNLMNYTNICPDIVITSRWFEVLSIFPNAKKIIWFQDAHFGSPKTNDVFLMADHIVCSSQWHRSYIAERYVHGIDGNKINIIPLGIRKEWFEGYVEKDSFKCIYSSNPDRGLYILLDMWEEITKEIPEIKLEIYYGWEGLKKWNQSANWLENVSKQESYVQDIVSKFKNITLKGSLTKSELAKEFMSASLCLYPNNFWETFCLTALETQLAGVPMITTDKGALSTTLDNECNILIKKDCYSKEYKKEFIDSLKFLFENRRALDDYSNKCKQFVSSNKNSWFEIGELWNSLFF